MSAMYTKRNEEEYITDREGQKLLHFMPSLSLIPPSISLSPWASTSPNPAWVTDTQGKVCVRVCVCTCAVVYKQDVAAIRRNPICSGGGKKKKKKTCTSLVNNKRIRVRLNRNKHTKMC